jgi:hypothetical protein
MIGPKRGTQAWKRQTRCTLYGINVHTLEVESVSLTNGGMLTRWSKSGPYSHPVAGRQPRSEVVIVFNLTDVIELYPPLDTWQTDSVKRLQEKAADMRGEKEARP